MQKPVDTSHSLIEASREHERRKSPAGKNFAQLTLWSWPCRVFVHSKVSKSQSLIDRSALQETNKSPLLGSNDTELTVAVWPLSIFSKFPVS